MTISVPGSFLTTTITTTATPGEEIYDIVVPHVQSFTTDGASSAAWETYDQIATRNVVLLSRGDKTLGNGAGDSKIYVQFDAETSATALRVTVHGDWSTASSTGSRSSATTVLTPGTTDDIAVWVGTNEYEGVLVFQRDTIEGHATWGQIFRAQIPAAHQGTAFATAAVAGGPDIIIPLDRNLINTLQVGHQCWKVPQTAVGDVLSGDAIAIGTVQAITASSVTLDIATVEIGDLIGCYPQPVYIGDATFDSTLEFVNDLVGTSGAIFTASNAAYSGQHSIENPSINTDVALGSSSFPGENNVNEHFMGVRSLLHTWASTGKDTMVDGATERLHHNNDLKFWVFPQLGIADGRVAAVGPLGPGF